jgi:hypothetical protein
MKELTLINRYPQTQERPKPPVEQRVRVIRRSQTQTRGSRTWTKQDLIDNEILENVPKAMKAKVQLLLNKNEEQSRH